MAEQSGSQQNMAKLRFRALTSILRRTPRPAGDADTYEQSDIKLKFKLWVYSVLLRCLNVVNKDLIMKGHREIGSCPVAVPSSVPSDDYYKMDAKPRGICLIINNEKFHRKENDRPGSAIDCLNLQNTFRRLDFDVRMYHNLTDTELARVLRDFARQNHSHFDCFVCCILSHGNEGSVLGTNGKTVLLKDITAQFKALFCPSLAGKPKLFFIQACRGITRQQGYSPDLEMDATQTAQELLPNEGDFLLGHSTVPGFVSYRNKYQGTWYISTLTQMLDQYAHSLQLLDILVKVNREVGSKNSGDQEKQIPMPAFTLRKRVLFK